MNMSVSSIVSKDGKREIYVLFTEGTRSAEGRLSDYKMISNKGFSREEIDMLEAYMHRETDRIVQMAKNINVMDAFLNG
ncbi:MAG: hypothetical protein J1E03_00745 [Acetatifactor sp.]|nr:hypothetical protein [Acetatifactor sp.]